MDVYYVQIYQIAHFKYVYQLYLNKAVFKQFLSKSQLGKWSLLAFLLVV